MLGHYSTILGGTTYGEVHGITPRKAQSSSCFFRFLYLFRISLGSGSSVDRDAQLLLLSAFGSQSFSVAIDLTKHSAVE